MLVWNFLKTFTVLKFPDLSWEKFLEDLPVPLHDMEGSSTPVGMPNAVSHPKAHQFLSYYY